MKTQLFFISIFTSLLSFAQWDLFLSGEGYTPLTYNPASFGQRNTFSANLIGWNSGLSSVRANAVIFNTEYRIYHDAKENSVWSGPVGIGLNYVGQYYDLLEQNEFSLMISKGVYLGGTYLSLGFSPGLMNFKFIDEWTPPQTTNDPSLPEAGDQQTKFNMGSGLFWYGENFFVSFSTTHIFEPYYDELSFSSARHFHVDAGYRFNLKSFSIYPVFFYKSVHGINAAQLQSNFEFFEQKLVLTGGYRFNSGLMAGAAFMLRGFRLGYSFNHSSSALSNATWTSHEARLSFML